MIVDKRLDSAELLFVVPISADGERLPLRDAVRAVDDLAASTAFENTFG